MRSRGVIDRRRLRQLRSDRGRRRRPRTIIDVDYTEVSTAVVSNRGGMGTGAGEGRRMDILGAAIMSVPI
jgi:hypothetical protein